MHTWKSRYGAFSLVLLFVLAGLLTSCDGSSPTPAPDRIVLNLRWLHQTQFAGFYVAAQEGYYADVGLVVSIEPQDFGELSDIDQVIAGENAFGIATPAEIVVARSEGKPVRAVGVIFRTSPEMWLVKPDAGIRSPEDFLGQKVALSPGSSSIVYRAMMERLGIDRNQVEEIEVSIWDLWECWEIAPVCSNYAINGPVTLDLAGEDYVVIWPSDYGINWYGDLIFTTDAMIADHPDIVDRFVRASLRGWKTAIEDPALATKVTLSYDATLDEEFQNRAMLVSIPLIDTGVTIGLMEERVWQNVHDVLLNQGVIEAPLDIDTLYTNQFVE